MHRKGGYHDYASNIFCLTVPKNFAEEPLLVSEKFWYKKLPCIRGIRGGVSRFPVVLLKLKNVGKVWDSKPYVALQNPVVLPSTMPWEQLEFLTNVSEIIRICGPTEIRTPTHCMRNICPHPITEIIYLNLKIVGKKTLIKKRNNPTILNEYFFLHIWICSEKAKNWKKFMPGTSRR